MAGEPELADLEIDDAGAKGEEEPMADLEDPATATLVDDMAEEDLEEEGEAAGEEEEADEGNLEDEEMDEMLAAAFDRQIDELMMQQMMAEMLMPHFETEQIDAALENLDLMDILADMEAETPEDMQEQLFDVVVEKIHEEEEEGDEAGAEEEEGNGTFVFGDAVEEDEAENR